MSDRPPLRVARTAARDLLGQALAELLGRPWRSLLTVLGTILGVGMLVAIMGLTKSAQARINERFDALISSEVSGQEQQASEGAVIQDSERSAVMRLRGVRAAGVIRQLPEGVKVQPSALRQQTATATPPLLSASVGALEVVGPTLSAGRVFTPAEEAHRAQVALLGSEAAQELGVSPAQLPSFVYLDGERFLVAGIVSNVRRHDEFLLALVIPDSTERALFGTKGTNPQMIVATSIGYAGAVGNVLAATMYPAEPSRISVSTPAEPVGLREEVSGDVTGLLAILAGVSLLVGLVGIANTTLVAVLERRGEIGLRRAVGARRAQIAVQFLTESLVLGVLGGLLGDAFGCSAVAISALAKGWVPIEPTWVLFVAPLIGGATGLLAGAYPAGRAARLDPATALAR